MFITNSITKKILESLVHETFSLFGTHSCSSLLDSLKFLGFYYATNAGISINIEDLKTPDEKKEFLKIAENETNEVSERWKDGMISNTERFQTIIDSWNIATESLKSRIIEYYENFDPVNNLYIMAFSGARGNMSQVRQLVGMRGLMSDQAGKIIDLPIQTNFREGLSSIDYIISSYGARKGIVDTALKTADSGYLTRRLIYVAQDLVIREKNCQTKKGLLVLLHKTSNTKNLIGRVLLATNSSPFPYKKSSQNQVNNTYFSLQKENKGKKGKKDKKKIEKTDFFLTKEKLDELKEKGPMTLTIRSPLTCNSVGSICQKCYGWDLATQHMVSLGEAVGIIAAQSIGEPGTQLTMRTFHTGGIFTSENSKQILAPFSGKLIIPQDLPLVSYRTNHGIMVSKLKQEANLVLITWTGITKEIYLKSGSFLYLHTSGFVKKNQLICEYQTNAIILGARRLKPIYNGAAGEVKFQSLSFFRFIRDQNEPTKKVKVTKNNGILWLASGKICPVPSGAEYLFPNYLKEEKSFAKLKLTSPFAGIVEITEKKICLFQDPSFPSFSSSEETQSSNNKFQVEEKKERQNNLNKANEESEKNNENVENGEKEKYGEKIEFEFANLQKKFPNSKISFSLIVKNYQYIDAYTTLGFFYLFPKTEKVENVEKIVKKESKIYSVRKKKGNNVDTFFLITEEDIWKVESDQMNQNFAFPTEKKVARRGHFFTKSYSFVQPGFFLEKNGSQLIFQKAVPIFLNSGTIINYKQGDFVLAKKFFATLVTCTQQTEDIVQGLPKIEELIEARKPKIKAYLATRPGICLKSSSSLMDTSMTFEPNEVFKCKLRKSTELRDLGKKKEKLFLQISHSIPANAETGNSGVFRIFDKKLVKVTPIPFGFEPIKRKKATPNLYFPYYNFFNKKFLINYKKAHSNWIFLGAKRKKRKYAYIDYTLYDYENPNKNNFKNKQKELIPGYLFQNKRLNNLLIVKTVENEFLLLECITPIKRYCLSLRASLLFRPGHFVDIAEPISQGMIDLHELLSILVSYHQVFDGVYLGTIRSLNKFQLILMNSIEGIYESQGITIASKHVEIIVRQMTSKAIIRESGDTPLLPGELVRISFLLEIDKAFQEAKNFQPPIYEPFLFSTTNSSLNKEGFLSAAGFQETKRILTKAALEGTSDWLRGLKECVILGRLVPAGSTFLNYKNYLDLVYLFKD
jgi:hypothetical protein